MTTTPRPAAPVLIAGVLGCATMALLQRLDAEYATTDTLAKPTVAAMYATYGAHSAALV